MISRDDGDVRSNLSVVSNLDSSETLDVAARLCTRITVDTDQYLSGLYDFTCEMNAPVCLTIESQNLLKNPHLEGDRSLFSTIGIQKVKVRQAADYSVGSGLDCTQSPAQDPDWQDTKLVAPSRCCHFFRTIQFSIGCTTPGIRAARFGPQLSCAISPISKPQRTPSIRLSTRGTSTLISTV